MQLACHRVGAFEKTAVYLISGYWNTNQEGLAVAAKRRSIYRYGFATVLDELLAVTDPRHKANCPPAIR